MSVSRTLRRSIGGVWTLVLAGVAFVVASFGGAAVSGALAGFLAGFGIGTSRVDVLPVVGATTPWLLLAPITGILAAGYVVRRRS